MDATTFSRTHITFIASRARCRGETRAKARAGTRDRARRARDARMRMTSPSNDDARSSAGDTASALGKVLGSADVQENAQEVTKKTTTGRAAGGISPEMRKKLLGESVNLGGLPEKPMPSNIFLNIILAITALVIVAYVGGIRP